MPLERFPGEGIIVDDCQPDLLPRRDASRFACRGLIHFCQSDPKPVVVSSRLTMRMERFGEIDLPVGEEAGMKKMHENGFWEHDACWFV